MWKVTTNLSISPGIHILHDCMSPVGQKSGWISVPIVTRLYISSYFMMNLVSYHIVQACLISTPLHPKSLLPYSKSERLFLIYQLFLSIPPNSFFVLVLYMDLQTHFKSPISKCDTFLRALCSCKTWDSWEQ